jgi:hypothetical protein
VSGGSAGAHGVVFRPKQSRFLTIPQSPLSYWLRERFFDLLAGPTLGDVADVVQGLATANDPRFVRFVWEAPPLEWGRDVRARRWAPFEKGGGYGKWFGHHFWVVDWEHNGARIKAFPASVIRNEQYYFKPGWTYSYMARGSLGLRVLDKGTIFSHLASAIFFRDSSGGRAAFGNSRFSSAIIRSISAKIQLNESYVSRVPILKDWGFLGALERSALTLKRELVALEPTERTFVVQAGGDSVTRSWSASGQRSYSLAAVLHTVEGIAEGRALTGLELDERDISAVLGETGTPAGWCRLVVGYEAVASLLDLKIDPELLAPLKDHPRINPTPDELADLKRRLRALYEAGPGASPEPDEQTETPDTDDDESEEAVVSGARIPIPPETFLEELSQKLEIHPISIYWLLRELREKDGAVCLPELRRFVSDHFTVMVLRMLGHRWPRQIEANEPIPDWAEPSGIIPITEGAGADSLLSRVRQQIAADFGAERVFAIGREFEEIMGVALEVWLARDFFRNHISQFRKRPIAWQLQSTPETSGASGNGRGKRARRKTRADRTPIFSCLVYYHRLDDQLLGTIRTQYAHPMRLRMETELRELERIDAKARTVEQEQRRAGLIVRIEELKDFEARLERVEQAGFESEALAKIADKEPLDKWTSRDGEREHPRERDAFMAQERRYDPDINDGVRVNIAPLQKAGLLAAEVLAAKDLDKAISDRAQWRDDERRWCREGKLPRPGWWK